MMNLLSIFWDLVLESAPWLLVGYLLAGIIKQVIPASWVEKQLATPGYSSILKGAFIGAPLPLCSCGVIPTALAIRKAGASKGATSSLFWWPRPKQEWTRSHFPMRCWARFLPSPGPSARW